MTLETSFTATSSLSHNRLTDQIFPSASENSNLISFCFHHLSRQKSRHRFGVKNVDIGTCYSIPPLLLCNMQLPYFFYIKVYSIQGSRDTHGRVLLNEEYDIIIREVRGK